MSLNEKKLVNHCTKYHTFIIVILLWCFTQQSCHPIFNCLRVRVRVCICWNFMGLPLIIKFNNTLFIDFDFHRVHVYWLTIWNTKLLLINWCYCKRSLSDITLLVEQVYIIKYDSCSCTLCVCVCNINTHYKF